ncbi:MAG: carboxyl transferase domain-containing protein, partial [Paenisporosarcina sp.]
IEDPKERIKFVQEKHQEYKEEINIYKLASEMIIDEIVKPSDLRSVLADRYRAYSTKDIPQPPRKHPVYPV